jgi:hypothetical protein
MATIVILLWRRTLVDELTNARLELAFDGLLSHRRQLLLETSLEFGT